MDTKQVQLNSKILKSEKEIVLYENGEQMILQLRHDVSSEEDMLTPSVRVGVSLTPAELVTLAFEFLRVAAPHVDQMQEVQRKESERLMTQPDWLPS